MSVILRSFLGVFLLSITPQEAFCHLSLKSIYDKEEDPPPLANLLNLSPHTVIPKKEIDDSSKFWRFEFLYECALDGESFYLEELQKQASVKDSAAVFPSLLLLSLIHI